MYVHLFVFYAIHFHLPLTLEYLCDQIHNQTPTYPHQHLRSVINAFNHIHTYTIIRVSICITVIYNVNIIYLVREFRLRSLYNTHTCITVLITFPADYRQGCCSRKQQLQIYLVLYTYV